MLNEDMLKGKSTVRIQKSKVKIQKYTLPVSVLTSVGAESIFEFLILIFDFPRSLSHHSNRLFLAAEHAIEIYKIVRQFIVAFRHQPNEDVEIVYAVEDEDLSPGKLILLLHELDGDVCIV